MKVLITCDALDLIKRRGGYAQVHFRPPAGSSGYELEVVARRRPFSMAIYATPLFDVVIQIPPELERWSHTLGIKAAPAWPLPVLDAEMGAPWGRLHTAQCSHHPRRNLLLDLFPL
ncbi:MAG: hypothetical protein FJ319_03095 [SAR202 cluster bacterium]|nr:hypothetical protein [SAR202 cluster bacterium]